MVNISHVTEAVGTYSELIAQAALLANGWRVHESKTSEAYDILATDPLSGEHVKVQVKTIHQRNDKGGELVVYAKRGNGSTYSKSEAAYFVGVWAQDGEIPRVYMFENRNIGEYWATEASAKHRWVEIPLGFNRDIYARSEQHDG